MWEIGNEKMGKNRGRHPKMTDWTRFVRFGVDLGTDPMKKTRPVFPNKWQEFKTSKYNNQDNFAVLTGSINDIIVIDIDKDKKTSEMPGLLWFESVFGTLKDSGTLVTKSWSGGYHIFFKYNKVVKNKNNYLDLNIDIQSDKKCVFQGKNYDIIYDNPIKELTPEQIRLLIQRRTEKDKAFEPKQNMIVNHPEKTGTMLDVSKRVTQTVNKSLETELNRPFTAEIENNTIKCVHKGCACIVKKGAVHSEEGHSMFYINNDRSVVKTCFSHGSVVIDRNDIRARAIHRGFKVILELQTEENNTYCRLKDDMLEAAFDGNYKRDQHGNIYKQVKSYAYIWHSEYKGFLNEIFKDDKEFERHPNNIENLVKFMKDYDSSKFAFINPDKRYIGFNNGILDTHTGDFCPEEECNGSIIVKKYLDVPFSGSTDTPLFDSIFDYQLKDNPEKKDIKKFIYFCLGRLFGIRDKYDFTLYLMGEAGCGKSLVIDVMKQFFRDIGAVSSTFEKTFGLSYLYKKDIIVCDDLPKDFSKVLPQTVFQSCISGGELSIAFKGGEAKTVKWDVPLLFAGNYNPDYVDKGQISRRIVTFEFRNIVRKSDIDTGLYRRILETELDKIALKSIKTYNEVLNDHSFMDKGIWSICPEYFRDNQEELKKDRNPLYKFVVEKCVYVIGSYLLKSEIRERFCEYLGKPIKKLDHGTFIQANENYTFSSVKICLHCSKISSQTCCDRSNNKDRITKDVIMNIKFI